MVPTSELAGDGRIAEVGDLPEDVHADLSDIDERSTPAGPQSSSTAKPNSLAVASRIILGVI